MTANAGAVAPLIPVHRAGPMTSAGQSDPQRRRAATPASVARDRVHDHRDDDDAQGRAGGKRQAETGSGCHPEGEHRVAAADQQRQGQDEGQDLASPPYEPVVTAHKTVATAASRKSNTQWGSRTNGRAGVVMTASA